MARPGFLDRTSIIATSIPEEVKSCSKLLNKNDLDPSIVPALLQVVHLHLLGSDAVQDEFQACSAKYGSEVLKVYPGILQIIKLAVRLPQHSLKRKDFIEDLISLNIPKKFHEDFEKLVFSSSRAEIDEACSKNKPRYPTLESFRWRVDVAISTSRLSRVLEPSILMLLKTSTGEGKCFEVSKEKFHELRYAVAYVLKQMQQIEKRSVLQIKT